MKPHENFQQNCIYLKLHKDWKKNLETVYRRLVNPRETHMLISTDQKRRVTQLQNPTSLVYRWQRSFSKNKCLNQSENHSVYGKTNVMTPLKAKCKLYLQQIMTTYRFDKNNSLVQRTEWLNQNKYVRFSDFTSRAK